MRTSLCRAVTGTRSCLGSISVHRHYTETAVIANKTTIRKPKQTPAVTKPSLNFDAFKLPEIPQNQSSVDELAWKQYADLVDQTVSKPEFHGRLRISEEQSQAVVDWLRRRDTVDWKVPNNKQDLQHKLQTQKAQFIQQVGSKGHQIAQGALFHMISMCARLAQGAPATIIWNKVKDAGMQDQKLLHTLLHVTMNFCSSRKSAKLGRLSTLSILNILNLEQPGKEPEEKDDDGWTDQTDEIAAFHDLLYKPTEQTINIQVRLLVAQGKAADAEALLNEHADKIELRLRAYMPILKLYLEQRDASAALRLYKRMLTMPSVVMEADCFVTVLAGLTELGYFQTNSRPIEGATDVGYSFSSGPQLFDEIVTEMADKILEITAASAKRLYNAFVDGFTNSNLDHTTSLAPLKIMDKPAAKGDLIVSRVRVNPSTGECKRSGVRLRLIKLQDKEMEVLRQFIYELAINEQDAFLRTSEQTQDENAGLSLLRFFQWLDEREGEPFTAFVDGPNVGYFMQNFEEGRFSFHQIKLVLDSLESLGENALCILPFKYTFDHFYTSIGAGGPIGPRRQRLRSSEAKIQQEMLASGKIFVVPRGCLDDFYWMIATLSKQTASRKGRDLDVPVSDKTGRWPGARPIVISNDQMRDHKLDVLEPLLFRRWRSNFVVNCTFSVFVGDENKVSEVGFQTADIYSREIQSNKDSTGSTVWHFPIAETSDEWFCVRIPLAKRSSVRGSRIRK